MTDSFEVGDLVASLTMGNMLGVVEKKTAEWVYVLNLIDRKDPKNWQKRTSKYYLDEVSKVGFGKEQGGIIPKQEDVFEAMYGSPEHVSIILSLNSELSRDELPSIEYMCRCLSEHIFMPYCRSYFQFLYKLNPVPLDLPNGPNLLEEIIDAVDYPSTDILKLILFLIEKDAPLNDKIYQKILCILRGQSKDKKHSLLNRIITVALERGMDPFIKETTNDYNLFQMSIHCNNYELYDYLTSLPKVKEDP